MYRWVNKYVGIPFKSGGRTSDGCDCYGLVRMVLKNEYSLILPMLDGKYIDALDTETTKELFRQYVPLLCGDKIEKPEEKAIAVIKTQGLATHVALYAGDGFIIHTMLNTGTVCERLSNPTLTGRIEGWYRVSEGYSTGESVCNGTAGI